MNTTMQVDVAVVATASAIVGEKIASAVGRVIAETNPMPDWMQWLIGPFGAIICLALVLVWAAKRMDKKDEKYYELISDIKSISEQSITAIEQSTAATNASTKAIESLTEAIKK